MNSTRRSRGDGSASRNLAIEYERAEHRARVAQRVMERGVIEIAEVASKPHERTPDRRCAHCVESRFAGCRRSLARSSCCQSTSPPLS
jgi:hypothetical protein